MIEAFRKSHISTKLLILLILLNIIDFQTTKMLVEVFGYGVERNPAMLWVMQEMGSVYAILLAKIVILGFYAYWHVQLPVSGGIISKNVIKYPLFGLSIVFGVVCILNTNMVFQTYTGVGL